MNIDEIIAQIKLQLLYFLKLNFPSPPAINEPTRRHKTNRLIHILNDNLIVAHKHICLYLQNCFATNKPTFRFFWF